MLWRKDCREIKRITYRDKTNVHLDNVQALVAHALEEAGVQAWLGRERLKERWLRRGVPVLVLRCPQMAGECVVVEVDEGKGAVHVHRSGSGWKQGYSAQVNRALNSVLDPE